MAHCSIEVPEGFCDQLGGHLNAYITEVGGDTPTNILSEGASYEVVVSLELTAITKRMICGHWCVCVAAESIGPLAEPKTCQSKDMTNCDDAPEVVRFRLPEGWFGSAEGAQCGDVFNLSVTAVAYDNCEPPRPLGIAGFCTLGPVMVQ